MPARPPGASQTSCSGPTERPSPSSTTTVTSSAGTSTRPRGKRHSAASSTATSPSRSATRSPTSAWTSRSPAWRPHAAVSGSRLRRTDMEPPPIDPAAETAPPRPASPSRWRDRAVSAAIGLGSAIYLLLLWSLRVPWAPAWFRWIQGRIREVSEAGMTALVQAFGGKTLPPGWRWAGTGIVMGILLPWLFMALIGRGHPRDIGLRGPNRAGWRVLLAGYLLALPALFAMAW